MITAETARNKSLEVVKNSEAIKVIENQINEAINNGEAYIDVHYEKEFKQSLVESQIIYLLGKGYEVTEEITGGVNERTNKVRIKWNYIKSNKLDE